MLEFFYVFNFVYELIKLFVSFVWYDSGFLLCIVKWVFLGII